MMSKKKKEIRKKFRASVFSRDNYTCMMCNFCPDDRSILDAHHITDRKEMPNGGYVIENGITLCSSCHVFAEEFHSLGVAYPKYSVENLYEMINSSYEKAVKASKLLCLKNGPKHTAY